MPFDQVRFDRVCCKSRKAMLFYSSADALEWDERTGMPIAGGDYRANQVSLLRSMAHRIRTETAYGEDLQSLMEQSVDEDPASDHGSTIRGLFRDWDRDRKLPTELVQRASEATVRGQQRWDAVQSRRLFNVPRDPCPGHRNQARDR